MLFDHQLPPNPFLVVVATFLVVVLYFGVGVGVVSVILREDVVIIPCVEEDRVVEVVDFTGGIKGGKVGSVG